MHTATILAADDDGFWATAYPIIPHPAELIFGLVAFANEMRGRDRFGELSGAAPQIDGSTGHRQPVEKAEQVAGADVQLRAGEGGAVRAHPQSGIFME